MKFKVYQLLPVLTYGYNMGILLTEYEESLNIIEQTVLRQIFDAVREVDNWRIRAMKN